jgi:response regulator RpfG family c-di-GMP phosphodiesterase
MHRVLLVDDEEAVLSALRRVLRQSIADLAIETFCEPSQALLRARDIDFDLVISDYRMPRMDGVAFLRAFRKMQPTCPRMILSAQTDFNALVLAINSARIVRFIVKPWDNAEIVAAVEHALVLHDRVRMQKRNLATQRLPDAADLKREAERVHLEGLEPGITNVAWNPDGSLNLETLGETLP